MTLTNYQEANIAITEEPFAPVTTAPDLAALRSNHDALQQHAADVTARKNEAEIILEAKVAALRKAWAESFAELLAEYVDVTGAAGAAEQALRAAICRTWLDRGDIENKTVDKSLGLSVKAPPKVVIAKDREAEAIIWAQKNAPLAIVTTLDRKLFDMTVMALKLADRPEFIEIKHEPVAVIGKVL